MCPLKVLLEVVVLLAAETAPLLRLGPGLEDLVHHPDVLVNVSVGLGKTGRLREQARLRCLSDEKRKKFKFLTATIAPNNADQYYLILLLFLYSHTNTTHPHTQFECSNLATELAHCLLLEVDNLDVAGEVGHPVRLIAAQLALVARRLLRQQKIT